MSPRRLRSRGGYGAGAGDATASAIDRIAHSVSSRTRRCDVDPSARGIRRATPAPRQYCPELGARRARSPRQPLETNSAILARVVVRQRGVKTILLAIAIPVL